MTRNADCQPPRGRLSLTLSRAVGHYEGGFGCDPLLVSCAREVLAAILRPGNAGANNAADHLELFRARA